MSSDDGTLLDEIPGFPEHISAQLKKSWITTAEQFIAAAAASGGARVMAGNLGVSEGELKSALETSEKLIAQQDLDRLKKPTDTSEFGLGALPPEEAGPT
jgi:hypothetical protein